MPFDQLPAHIAKVSADTEVFEPGWYEAEMKRWNTERVRREKLYADYEAKLRKESTLTPQQQSEAAQLAVLQAQLAQAYQQGQEDYNAQKQQRLFQQQMLQAYQDRTQAMTPSQFPARINVYVPPQNTGNRLPSSTIRPYPFPYPY